MFVIADKNDIKKDLNNDIDRIKAEEARSDELLKTYETKKNTLTKQLNDLSPAPAK